MTGRFSPRQFDPESFQDANHLGEQLSIIKGRLRPSQKEDTMDKVWIWIALLALLLPVTVALTWLADSLFHDLVFWKQLTSHGSPADTPLSKDSEDDDKIEWVSNVEEFQSVCG